MRQLLTLARSFVRRHLVAVAAAVSAALVFTIVATLVLARPPLSLVTVKGDVTAGSVLTENDLEVAPRSADHASDSLVNPAEAVGRRTSVDLVAHSVVRAAYLNAPHPDEVAQRATLLLPVTVAMAQMVAVGDLIDIYRPCDESSLGVADPLSPSEAGDVCKAQLLTQGATVVDVRNDSDQWGGTQTSAVIVAINPKDIRVIAGVRDPSALVLVLVASATPSQPVEE